MDFASVTLAGHVVAVPVLRKGKNDKEYGTFSIAVNQWHGGQEVASFFNCMMPRSMYDSMCKANVGKGSSISLTGMLSLRTYKSDAGYDKTSADIKVLDWRYVGSAKRSDGTQKSTAPANAPAYWQNGRNAAPAQPSYGYGNAKSYAESEDDGDLPL